MEAGFGVHRQILTALVTVSLALGTPLHAFAQAETPDDDSLIELGDEFLDWASINQPTTPFAATRPARPAGWQPDWSRTALQSRQRELLQFQSRMKSIDGGLVSISDRIDASVLAAKMARINWELEVLGSPGRDPGFALIQSLGSVFDILVVHPLPDESQLAEIIIRLKRFPSIINATKLELNSAVPELADAAIARIGDVDSNMDQLESALVEIAPDNLQNELADGIRAARQALSSYKDWLILSQPRFDGAESIGEQKLRWYLGHVAMIPRSVDDILAESRLVMARVGAKLALEQHQRAQAPVAAPLDNVQRLILMMDISQSELNAYLETKNLVSDTAAQSGLQFSPLPRSLESLVYAGELVAFSHGEAPGNRFLRGIEDSGGFLERAAWSDPRLLLGWESSPGRNAQFLTASGHDRELRRHAIYEAQSAGIATYFHEQLLQSGLYSFKPASHELAQKFIAYQAALAQADIRIALGDLDFEGAVEFLGEVTNQDESQRQSDVHGLLSNPGSATAAFAVYGQIVRFLADASRIEGEDFSIRSFNDRLLLNAHVPITFQRWELLGNEEELEDLVEQRGRPATVPQ